MSRWGIIVREDKGRAIIQLNDGSRTIGMANISVSDYEQLCRSLMSAFVRIASENLFRTMQDKLWQDAQRVCREDVEAAKRRLVEFGWSKEHIEQFVKEMTIALASEVLNVLPERIR